MPNLQEYSSRQYQVVFRNIGYNSHIGKVIPQTFLTIPPLAVSSTATSTSFDDNTIAALVGPVLSPFKTHSSPMKMPPVDVIPTFFPRQARVCPISRVVVVFPLVPVTDTMGIEWGMLPETTYPVYPPPHFWFSLPKETNAF